ncbi:MAG: hypothetical protein M3069_32575 [Chloroflexota bacterium]|nr:hypothetical protein [Chloroflexota bacterium]
MTLLPRWVASLAVVVAAGVACVAPLAVHTSDQAKATVQLSAAAASPGTWIRVHGAGFQVGEYVEIVVTDPVGSQTSLGRVIADAMGATEAEVAPGEQARNGLSVLRLVGNKSNLVAAVPISLTGGADTGPMAGGQLWMLRTNAESSCEQCLLVHGQAP